MARSTIGSSSGTAQWHGDPKLDAHHGPVANATVDLGKALLNMFRIYIHKSEGAVVPVAEGLKHLIVLLAEVGGVRIVGERHAHVDAESRNAHAVRISDELGHSLIRRAPGDALEMRMQVPDLHCRAIPVIRGRIPDTVRFADDPGHSFFPGPVR